MNNIKTTALLILASATLGWALNDLTKAIKERRKLEKEAPFYDLISKSHDEKDLDKAEECLEKAKKLIETRKQRMVWELANLTLTLKKKGRK